MAAITFYDVVVSHVPLGPCKLVVSEDKLPRRIDGGTKLDMPEILSGARVEGDKVPVGVTSEHKTASGRQRPTVRGREVLDWTEVNRWASQPKLKSARCAVWRLPRTLCRNWHLTASSLLLFPFL
jgi:hypothetical protein